MTQSPFYNEEELKRLNSEETEILQAPSDANTIQGEDATYKEKTPAENKAEGNVQPINSTQQGFSQIGGQIGGAVRNIVEGGTTVPMGILDLGMDAIGRVPGAEWIDDAWDAKTKFKNPLFQQLRETASVVAPSVALGVATGGMSAGATGLSAVGRGLAALGINAAGEVAINAVSDQSEGETVSKMVKDAMPWMPVVDEWVTKDTDPPEVRRAKNQYEAVGLSVIGDVVGFAFSAGKPVMNWFKPKDKAAKEFMAGEVLVNMDSATATKISELQTQRAALDEQGQMLSQYIPTSPEEALQHSIDLDQLRKAYKATETESVELTAEYVTKGSSRLTESPLDSFVERQQISRELQVDDVGAQRLTRDPGNIELDPFISPKVFPEASSATFSMGPGYVSRNAADVAALKLGGSTGSPAPILSERAFFDISNGDKTTRDIVAELAETHRAAGDFDAIVDGFRYTKAQMSDAAWKIYSDIINATDVESTRKLFSTDNDIKTLLDGRKIKYLNDVQAEAVGYAMRDLVKQYIGSEVTEQSARVMDTLGREISDIADAHKALPELSDAERIHTMIGDRLAFLMEEYGVNKYIAGWSLKAQDRWKMMFQASGDKETTIQQLMQQFDLKRAEINNRAQGYKDMIQTIAREKPEAAQALIDAFALSNGNVDTFDKLLKWTQRQMSPMGLIAPLGDEGGLNAFAQGAWAVRYNNVLGGLSAGRAVLGNVVNLTLKPINAYMGTGLQMMLGRQTLDDLKRTHYAYNASWATNTRALSDTFSHFKKLHIAGKWSDDLHLNPQTIARDDLVTGTPSVIQLLDDMVPVWEKEGNIGALFQYKQVKTLHQLGNWNMMKYGTNALESADVFVRSTVAMQLARTRAYDEVMSIGYKGQELVDQLAKAEKLAYAEMFDANGNITDQALKYASGEIALQLDDATANFINMATGKVPALKPFFMFPKTGMNGVKLAMSYTPIAMLPGASRYGKVLSAGNDLEKIKAALLTHGIDFDQTPNAMAIFKGLEAEYTGRVAFGSMMFTSLMGYAIGGKIRGNGPPNKSERQKLRDNFGWQPKTINIGGKWVSYAGYEPLDTILTLVGDLGYYATDIGSPLMEDYGTKIAWTLAATFVNKTWLQGLDPLLAILDGDESRLTRFLANEARAAIPWSGALGVGANAISNTQKDIYNDFMGYIKNRLPGPNTELPDRIDIFTGKPINDIDNPILRALNAINPVKISEGTEPWRQWLIDSGWDGIAMIRTDSTGNHEYTSAEREQIYKYIGEQQIWKQYERLRTNKKYNDQLDRIRAMRVKGYDSKTIRSASSEVYKVLDGIVKDAQKKAELRLQSENEPMWRSIQESIRTKNLLGQGRIDDAARAADRRKAAIEELTQMYK